MSTDLLFREDDLSKSRVFEWLMVNQLRTEFFWRNSYKNEVDAVMINGKPVPVEIRIGEVGFGGMFAFMKSLRLLKVMRSLLIKKIDRNSMGK